MPKVAATQRTLSDKQREVLKANAWKPGQSGNPGGENGLAKVQGDGRAWWANGGLKRVIGYADDPHSRLHWKAIELLAKHFLPEEAKTIANADGTPLTPPWLPGATLMVIE